MCGSEIETKEVNSSNGVYLLFPDFVTQKTLIL